MENGIEELRCPDCREIVCKRTEDGIIYAIASKGRGQSRQYVCIAVWCCGNKIAELENFSAMRPVDFKTSFLHRSLPPTGKVPTKREK